MGFESQEGQRPVPAKETQLTDAVYEQLRHAMAGDAAGFTAIYRDYLADARQTLRALRMCVKARHVGEVRAKAHYMRSSSLVLGAQGVARHAASLEQAAIAGQTERFGDLLKKTERAVNGIQLELYRRLGSGVLPADETAA